MKYGDWLRSAEQKLIRAGIGTARLDALVLLEDTAGHNRARLLAHLDSKMSPSLVAQLDKLLKRRARHEPLAYLRGKTEFYGREFIIAPAVLEPRPESETMIDALKSLPGLTSPLRISDVGAGSGALGITAALELQGSEVELLEIDEDAIKLARRNVDKFTLPILVKRSDLLSNSLNNSRLLLCNLPYVPDEFHINLAAIHEPKLAIFGGQDGLDLYRRLFTQVNTLRNQPLYILTEAFPSQHATLGEIAMRAGYKQLRVTDFIQVFKHTK